MDFDNRRYLGALTFRAVCIFSCTFFCCNEYFRCMNLGKIEEGTAVMLL